jgi:hypothetical protein
LKSLNKPNQRFRRIVCFQWVGLDFVSPFSRIGSSPSECSDPALAQLAFRQVQGIRHYSRQFLKIGTNFSIFDLFIDPPAVRCEETSERGLIGETTRA